MITIEQAKQLKVGDVIHAIRFGQTKCFKWTVLSIDNESNPDKVNVLLINPSNRETYLKEYNLRFIHLESDCPINKSRRFTLAECIEFKINKKELAKHYGLKSFDTAIPIDLFRDLIGDGVELPHGAFHFVYCYDNSTFGELFPLTIEGENRMRELDLTIPELKGK